MKVTLLIVLAFAAAIACHAKDTMIPTVERNGRPYVRLASLAGHEEIAAKQLPGNGQWVACAGERCVLLKDVMREKTETWVAVAVLSEAIGATPRYDAKKEHVAFDFQPAIKREVEAATRPGNLAPNFRLARLDGSPVSLADFAGQRVLINSWASW
jgi:hypothetical protein